MNLHSFEICILLHKKFESILLFYLISLHLPFILTLFYSTTLLAFFLLFSESFDYFCINLCRGIFLCMSVGWLVFVGGVCFESFANWSEEICRETRTVMEVIIATIITPSTAGVSLVFQCSNGGGINRNWTELLAAEQWWKQKVQ